jgi:hypothetical protein
VIVSRRVSRRACRSTSSHRRQISAALTSRGLSADDRALSPSVSDLRSGAPRASRPRRFAGRSADCSSVPVVVMAMMAPSVVPAAIVVGA